ncbi:hydrolase [Clavibacter sepedonicus]|uniref:Hydrolase n=1 Tax=Clavibacter sepedonicus TaxID=31964 RepID=B0RBQ3_CLASE|nr:MULTISPECIES: hydrolase [Clavibacter]MBD5381698.1 hydrolase [Clavibacter sp.]OQJ48885.1 hydrolase [Clavibacter sepedonicus]OQJ53804.1 hydrolase [Clavibacter sepedonicus]UUK65313.1 hydrolase [Clavibacter sepedonicus]CAQ00454.1 putative hydrolase [Clavibacter sepedonicus]
MTRGVGTGGAGPAGVWRVRELRLERIHREVAVRIAGGRVTLADPADEVLGRLDLSISDGVVDRHVHLGLVDRAALAGSPVTAVVDLGWDPAEIARIAARPPTGVDVRYAGPFHTALGGYPSDRAWAPSAAVREVARAEDAAAAVAEARAGGSGAVKIVLHDGGQLLADGVLAALVDAAHDAGLPAAVHAEGAGQAARAIRAGADVLVHVPWTERLDDATLRASATRDVLWISTLAIHDGADLATALDNARRYVALGGRVAYGTDLGNGDLPVGLNAREVELLGEVGLRGPALLEAVLGSAPGVIAHGLASPDPLPSSVEATAAQLVAWLRGAHRLGPADLPG